MNSSTPSLPFPVSAERTLLNELQGELADRASTTQFAHSGVSLVFALMLAGAAAKLFWDSFHFPVLGVMAATAALGLSTYAVIQYLRGKRSLVNEMTMFDSVLDLRRGLGMDDPSVLLPP